MIRIKNINRIKMVINISYQNNSNHKYFRKEITVRSNHKKFPTAAAVSAALISKEKSTIISDMIIFRRDQCIRK